MHKTLTISKLYYRTLRSAFYYRIVIYFCNNFTLNQTFMGCSEDLSFYLMKWWNTWWNQLNEFYFYDYFVFFRMPKCRSCGMRTVTFYTVYIMPFQRNIVILPISVSLCMMGCSLWKMETGRRQVNSHYRDMSSRRPHVSSCDIAWEIGSVLLHMQCKLHMGPRLKKNNTEASSGMACSEQSLEKRKKQNIIACDKILPFHPPATSHSTICPELATADAWVAGGMFRWAPCGGRREEETCPPPSIKCAWVHSTTTHRQAGAYRAICGDGEGTACSRPGAKDAAWSTHVL